MHRLVLGVLAALLTLPALAQTAHKSPPQPSREQRNLYFLFPYNDRLTVKSLNGRALGSADQPIFTFIEGAMRMNGFGGCNTVNADFRAGAGEMRFGPLNFTTRKCGNPTDANELAVFKALQGATNWKPAGYRSIVITGRAGTLVLVPAF